MPGQSPRPQCENATTFDADGRSPQLAPSRVRANEKKESYGDDDMIVNYHDAVLYGRDLKLLEDEGTGMSTSSSSGWLNDALLHFQLLRLAHQWRQSHYAEEPFLGPTNESAPSSSSLSSAPRGGGAPFLCADPSVLSFLTMLNPAGGGLHGDEQADDNENEEDEELQSIAAAHNNFRGVQVFFLPVNDGLAAPGAAARKAATTAQGTHWSLLVAVVVVDDVVVSDGEPGRDDESAFHRHESRNEKKNRRLAYFHFDSVPGHNEPAARALATQWDCLWRVADRANKDEARSSAASASSSRKRQRNAAGVEAQPPSPVSVRECRAPRQANGHDCGVHVLASVEALMKSMPGWNDGDFQHLNDAELPNLVREWEEALQRHLGSDPARACAALRRRMAHDIRALGGATGGP